MKPSAPERKAKRFFIPAAVLIILFAVLRLSYTAHADNYGPGIFAETYCVINGNSKEVLIEHDKDRRMYPASTTKILTALVVLERVKDLDQMLTFTESAVNVDPSSSTLHPKAAVGETMSVRDALYGMMLQSGNECGAMLGEFTAGSEAAFAELMNQRAAEIGAVNSHFVNAYGIHHDDHYTTAYDLCLILKAAMDNPGFREIMKNTVYTIPATNLSEARTIRNTHRLINGDIPEEGILGGKTGSTPQAGRVLTTAAFQNGLYSISALMKSDASNMYSDEAVLLEYAGYVHAGDTGKLKEEAKNDTVTAIQNVKIRYSPSVRAGSAGILYQGQSLHRVGEINGWSKVEFEGRLVYLNSAYLDYPGRETAEAETPSGPEETDPESTPSGETGDESSGSESAESGSSDSGSPESGNTDPEGSESETTDPAPETPSESMNTESQDTQETDPAEAASSEKAGPGETDDPSGSQNPFTEESSQEPEKEGHGLWRFIMDHVDILLIALAAAVIVVFTILWILNFRRHRRLMERKKRLEERSGGSNDSSGSML